MTETCSWTRELLVVGRLWPSLQEEFTVLPTLVTVGTLVLEPQGRGSASDLRGLVGQHCPQSSLQMRMQLLTPGFSQVRP